MKRLLTRRFALLMSLLMVLGLWAVPSNSVKADETNDAEAIVDASQEAVLAIDEEDTTAEENIYTEEVSDQEVIYNDSADATEDDTSDETVSDEEEIAAEAEDAADETVDEEEDSADTVDETADDSDVEDEETDDAEDDEEAEDADSEEEFAFEYELDGNNAKIIGYVGTLPSELVIPSEIDGYTVTKIASSAFWEEDGLVSVKIPESVTTLSWGCFYGCDELTSVTLSNGITKIPGSAFHECINLTEIVIPESVTSIGDEAFKECSKLTSVTLSDNVTVIEEEAFQYSGLEQLTVLHSDGSSDTYTELNTNIFKNSVSVAEDAFYDTPFSTVSYGSYSLYYGLDGTGLSVIGYTGTLPSKLSIPSQIKGSNVTSIGYRSFMGAEITSVTIPDTVTEIGMSAFSHSELTNVTVPDSVTLIDSGAFQYSNVSSVELGSSVTTIEYAAFAGTALKTISIPASVQTIGGYAFSDTSLYEIYFEGDAPEFPNAPRKEYDDATNTYVYVKNQFANDTVVAFYDHSNTTWTSDIMQDYGGDVEWIAWDPKTEEIFATIEVLDDSLDGTSKIAVHIIGSGDPIVLECSLALKFFVNVEVDGQLVDPSNYTLRSGSTIITFSSSYLDTLTPGKHNVTMNYNINGRSCAVSTKILITTKEDQESGKNDVITGVKTNPESKYVSMVAHLVDINGNPMYNYTLEIHSEPKSATINSDGNASFNDIEVGNHTLYLKDQNGRVICSKAIKIQYADSYSITGGDTVNIIRGRKFRLNVQYDGEKLILLSVEGEGGSNSSSASSNPKTGDSAMPMLWTMMILLSCAGLVLVRRKSRA